MNVINAPGNSNRSFVLDPSSDQTAKRFDDPRLSNRAFAIFFIVTVLIALTLLLAPKARAQTTYTWSTTTTTSPWLTPGNWTVGGNPSTKFPGDATGTVTNEGAATDIAAIGAVNASVGNQIGINFATANGGLTLSAIDFLSSTSRAITIGDSAGTAGTLTLTGVTLNSIANTILANEGSFLLTLAPRAGGTKDMTLALGNSTDNVIQINGTGGLTISTVISGSGKNLTLRATGSGILTFDGNVDNTYNGTTTINSGELDLSRSGHTAIAGNLVIGDGSGTDTVKLTVNEQIADSSDVTINSSGVLNLNSKNEAIDGLSSSSSTSSVTLGSGTLTVGASNEPAATYAGVISGTGGLAKSGTGTQTLSGNNTYTGATTVNASGGTLEIANSGLPSSGRISGTSGVTVNSSGTLLLSGSSGFTDRINNAATVTLAGGKLNLNGLSERGGTVAAPTFGVGALTLTATSTIDFGAGTTSIIEFNGLGTHTAGTVLQITNWNGVPVTGGGTERLLFAGTASSFTALYNQNDVSFNGASGYFVDQFSGFYEVTAVPEPSTWICGALALALLGWTQRRRFARVTKRAA